MRIVIFLSFILAAACSSGSSPPPTTPAGNPPATIGTTVETKVEPEPQPQPEPQGSAAEPAATPPDGGAVQPAEPAKKVCEAKPNPAACPEAQPNINAPCKKKGLECRYGNDCCKPVYACSKTLKFEAQFRGCE